MGGLKPYPDYTKINAEWLCKMPKHWKVVYGSSVLRKKREKNYGMIEDTVLSLSYGKIVIKPPEKLHGLVPESFETYQIVDPCDIIIRPTDLQNDWVTIRVAISYKRGIITSAYICMQAHKPITCVYAYYLLLAYDLQKVFYGMGSGLRQNLDWSDFKRLPVLVPPKEEQDQIVRYLENKLAKINKFIRNKKRLIELLKEQKQAVINQAVTKGLDPNAKMKPSGIEWLGDVPEWWEVVAIKRLSPVKRGASPRPIDDPKYFSNDGEYSWVRISDVTASERHLEKTLQRLSSLGQSLSVALEPGSLFLSIAGSVGIPIITKIKCCIHDGFVYFPRLIIEPEYLYYVFKNRHLFIGLGKMGTQLNLNTQTVGSIFIALPKKGERDRIVNYLDYQTKTIDQTIDRINKEIDLITEYRTSLISVVVTGKVDVRGIAVEEPPADDIEALEPAELEADTLQEEELMESEVG